MQQASFFTAFLDANAANFGQFVFYSQAKHFSHFFSFKILKSTEQ